MVSQLWADVKYHVPTGFGFSLKASGFLFQSPPVFIHRTRLGVNFSLAHKKILAVLKNSQDFWFGVRLKGLEPSRLATLDPKSSASTNSATSACDVGAKVQHFLGFTARIL